MLALHPRIANGTAWLFGALFALILYYRLPLHPLHKAIAFGFMANLLLLTFGARPVEALRFRGAHARQLRELLGLHARWPPYWAWAAWRRDDPPPADPAVVDRLQPWR